MPSHQRGLTLIEILVTVLVLAIGLLGLAGLQATAVRFNTRAYIRSQATNLAYDMADRMRVNLIAATNGAYDIAIGTNPTGTTLAAQDLQEWRTALTALPSGTGSIARPAIIGNVFTIAIQWDEWDDGQRIIAPRLWQMRVDLPCPVGLTCD